MKFYIPVPDDYQLKIGQVVKLIDGGPDMTIVLVDVCGVRVTYSDGGQLYAETFKREMLELRVIIPEMGVI